MMRRKTRFGHFKSSETTWYETDKKVHRESEGKHDCLAQFKFVIFLILKVIKSSSL
jgi:hypothetical protein